MQYRTGKKHLLNFVVRKMIGDNIDPMPFGSSDNKDECIKRSERLHEINSHVFSFLVQERDTDKIVHVVRRR